MFDGFSPSEEQWCAERLYIKGKLYRGQLYKALANTLLKAPVEFEENNTIGYLQDNSFVIFLESLCFQNYEGYGWFKVIAGDLVGWCFFSKLLELTTDNIDSNSINENNIIRDES